MVKNGSVTCPLLHPLGLYAVILLSQDDLLCLPAKMSTSAGSLGPLVLVARVTNQVRLGGAVGRLVGCLLGRLVSRLAEPELASSVRCAAAAPRRSPSSTRRHCARCPWT